MLRLDNMHAFYGKSQVLHGVNLRVQPGELVALLGRNGAGRSTLAKAIMGLVPWRGSMTWQGRSLAGWPTHQIARAGIGYVPESRDVFPGLTVQQNLLLGLPAKRQASRWSLEEMYALFPQLAQRRDTPAGVLSGGEQQMLTLCRSLLGAPQLLLIDEPTEGLAPQLVQQVGQFLQHLKSQGLALLLIEQKLHIALAIADRVLVMGQGQIVFEGTPQQLRAQPGVIEEWLQV